MYEVVEQVLDIVQENNLCAVESITLQVGALASVIPRYLHACYPAAVDGTLLADTELEIEILPANALCHHCQQVFNAAEHKTGCPHCASTDAELLSGREFYIKEIRAC